MKCNLPNCDNPVAKATYKGKSRRKKYCCIGHAKIGALNSIAISGAKRKRKEIKTCSTKYCHRLYTGNNEGKQCYHCRTNHTGICKLDGCDIPIPIERKSTALFCSDKCCTRYHKVNMRNKYKPKDRIPCGTLGCKNLFIKTSNAQLYCPECQDKTASRVYSQDYGEIAPGPSYKDHRHIICNRNGKGPLCDNYATCPQLAPSKKRTDILDLVMKYELNGNVDCWEHTPDTVQRANFGDSFGLCTVNN